MDDARRFRVNAADCLLAAKTCEPGYREMILSISACWHSLARQDEAMNMLLASWTQAQSSGTQEFAVNTAGDVMPNKQALTEYRFRPELIAAMRAAFLKACEAPQVKDAGHGTTEIVAEKILELAKAGETNSDRLCTGALRRLSQ